MLILGMLKFSFSPFQGKPCLGKNLEVDFSLNEHCHVYSGVLFNAERPIKSKIYFHKKRLDISSVQFKVWNKEKKAWH